MRNEFVPLFALAGRVIPILVVASCLNAQAAAQGSAASHPAEPKASLEAGISNADIIKMVKAGLGDQIVIGAIEGAPGRHFDLSPNALISLKTAGVSDAVVSVMQHATPVTPMTMPSMPTSAPPGPAPSPNATLAAGTVVRLQLATSNVSSDAVKVDQALEFTVIDDVMANGILVVKRGTSAWGKVTKVTTQRLTRAGAIEFSIDSVKGVTGQEIPLRAIHAVSGGRGMVMANDAHIDAGASFDATVDREISLSAFAVSAPANVPGAAPTVSPASASTASIGGAALVRLRPAKLNDGDSAIIETQMAANDATTKVKTYFNAQNIDFTVNADTGRVNTTWYNDHRCGPGIQHCEDRASVRVTADGGQTLLQIQVFERKREGGLSEKPWHENSTSKSKETTDLGSALEAALRK